MNRHIIHKLVLSLVLVSACSQGGQDNNPNINNPGDVDMSIPDGGIIPGGDGGMSGSDGGGGGKADMTVLMGIPCTPGTYRCGASNAVEICNSSGTAWLYSATCTVSCSAGLCTGACTPGEKRCNGKNVETCNTLGSAYMLTEACTTFCDAAVCAIPSLDVATNRMLDGDQLVDGDIIIHSGATLTSPAGNLTLRTRGLVVVETGASIVVNPTGKSSGGIPPGSNPRYYGGSGAGYGTAGTNSYNYGGSPWGSTTDADIQPGSPGGNGYGATNAGPGGGVLRIIAGKSITVGGQITANGSSGTYGAYGDGGSGSGGGVLLATPDKITITGSISANGGGASSGSYPGAAGGLGRVKVLNGGTRTITGTISATVTQGLLPPTQIASSTHPNSTLVYNDGFATFTASWNQAFTGLQGYYYKVSTKPSDPPTPANGGKVVTTETVTIPAKDLVAGANYLHLVPIDATSAVGTIESTFQINLNSEPPTIASTSHPSQTTWYPNGDVFFNWTYPDEERHFKGIYYVLDHYGDTIPTSGGTLIPVAQKMLLRGGLADGLWVMHMVPIDQQNYLTKQASHYRVRVGADPGTGTILGQVVDGMGKPVPNAQVTVNRGLWSMATNTAGSYNFMTQIPAGTWELRATSADGKLADIKTDTITKGGTTTVNFTLK